jgi:PKD repeat protein
MSRLRPGPAAFLGFTILTLVLAAGPGMAATPPELLSAQPAQRAVAVSGISISAPAQVNAAVGDTITIEASATGDPSAIITITVTGAPPGLTFETNTPTSTGATASLSGAVPSQGAWWIDWRAEDQFGGLDVTTTLLSVTSPDAPPVLGAIAGMSLYEGSIEHQQLTATDADGDPLTFSLVSGPSFMSVVTDNTGTGTAFGRAIAAPGNSDQGIWTVTVQVSDGASVDTGSFSVTVLEAQTFTPPYFTGLVLDMQVNEREVADQTVSAADADGNPLTFGKSYGPAFMTVTTTSPGSGTATGNVHLAPGSNDDGSYFAEVFVTDGFYNVYRGFFIAVINVPAPPVPGAPVWEMLGTFYDPRTSSGIQSAAASLIGDKLYVSHGYRYFESFHLSVYDVNQGTWAHGEPSASFARAGLAGATANGRHYAIGGSPPNSYVEEYDPISRVWSIKSPLPVARGGMGAAAWNNKIYVVGGRGGYYYGEGTTYNRLDVFDPVTNQWTARAPMPQAASEIGSTVAYQGKIYVFGGALGSNNHLGTTQIYDVATNTWRLGTPMPTPRGAALAGVIGTKIAVIGGYNGTQLTVTEMYDPASDTWSPGNEIPSPMAGMAMGATYDHRGIFVVGTDYYSSPGVLMRLRPLVTFQIPTELAGDEGQEMTFQVSASHYTGLPVTLRAAGLPPGASFSDHGDGTGTFSWTPGFDQAGTFAATFLGTSGDGSSGMGITALTVRNVNRGPSADPGGPYSSTAGVPLQLDGTGSSDPDGTALSYAWIFGDGTTGTGASPSHTYAASGTYGVALTVSDESLSDLAITTVTVVDLFQARAFTVGGGRTIRLGGGKPTWCAQLEPLGGSFALNLVDPASIVMKSTGTGSVDRISAALDKTSVGADRDGNGLEEITACFGKDDLRLLFDNIHGTQTVPVAIEGLLFTGGRFASAIDVSVHAPGGGPSASVSPNPLNPEATLTFHSPMDGTARIRIYGPDGRLVRELMDAHVSAGYHDVRFDGKDSGGSRLSSGVYFYRVETAAGMVGGRLAIVK